jgi:hypothetical protein
MSARLAALGGVLGLLVLIGASAVVCAQRRLFTRWFAVASVVLALVSIAGAFTIGYDGDGIQTTAGIAVLLDSVWILLASIYLWRKPALT